MTRGARDKNDPIMSDDIHRELDAINYPVARSQVCIMKLNKRRMIAHILAGGIVGAEVGFIIGFTFGRVFL